MKLLPTFLTIILVALAGCNKSTRQDKRPSPRIVTLSPALTEIVFDMGLGDHVVGVSEYTSLPAGTSLPVVGDAQSVRTEPLLAVQPDVLLTQSEVKHYDTVKKFLPELKVEHFNLATLEEVASAMERIGTIVNQPGLGQGAAAIFREELARVERKTKDLIPRRVMFVMDYQHPFAAGKGTFLDEMIRIAGGMNVLSHTKDWHKPSVETILIVKPQVVICQCKPAQAAEAKRYWTELLEKTVPDVRVYTVTDNTWTIAAGHLAKHTDQLAKMIHPELSGP